MHTSDDNHGPLLVTALGIFSGLGFLFLVLPILRKTSSKLVYSDLLSIINRYDADALYHIMQDHPKQTAEILAIYNWSQYLRQAPEGAKQRAQAIFLLAYFYQANFNNVSIKNSVPESADIDIAEILPAIKQHDLGLVSCLKQAALMLEQDVMLPLYPACLDEDTKTGLYLTLSELHNSGHSVVHADVTQALAQAQQGALSVLLFELVNRHDLTLTLWLAGNQQFIDFVKQQKSLINSLLKAFEHSPKQDRTIGQLLILTLLFTNSNPKDALIPAELVENKVYRLFPLYFAKMVKNSARTVFENRYYATLAKHRKLHDQLCHQLLSYLEHRDQPLSAPATLEHLMLQSGFAKLQANDQGNVSVVIKAEHLPVRKLSFTEIFRAGESEGFFNVTAFFTRAFSDAELEHNKLTWWLDYLKYSHNKELLTAKMFVVGPKIYGKTKEKTFNLLEVLANTNKLHHCKKLFYSDDECPSLLSIEDFKPEWLAQLTNAVLRDGRFYRAIEREVYQRLTDGLACPNWQILKQQLSQDACRLNIEEKQLLLSSRSFPAYLYCQRPSHQSDWLGKAEFGLSYHEASVYGVRTSNNNILEKAFFGHNRNVEQTVTAINAAGKDYDAHECHRLATIYPELIVRYQERQRQQGR